MTARILAVVSLGVFGFQVLAADWPTFRADALQTGVGQDKLPKKLETLWTFETKDAVEAAAAIVNGVVYVGSYDEHLYALDLATGKEKWKFKAGPIKAAVGVRAGLVYVGNIDGDFFCVAADTGKEKWRYKTEGEISSGANFAGDNVLFGSGDEHLYCLGPDGKLVWKYKVPGGPVNGSPAVVGDRTFAAGCDSNLHVIDLKQGKQLAKVDLGGQVGASAAVHGDRIYVGTMSSNQVLAIDWKKAEIAWQFEAPKAANAFFASPAVTEQFVLAGSRDRRIWAIDRKTGKEAWSFLTDKHVNGSPVVVGDKVYGPSLDGKLYVLDLAKGTLLQDVKLGAPLSASPAVGGGRLVIGTEKGTVYCLGKK
ncbi:MAG: PQQ-binding-like beta-propeller repeat protein [Planctomycetia bacterium]|nr:PQQ-binding-like beta-propeller repeat protein [Planctomycetia bacterium]